MLHMRIETFHEYQSAPDLPQNVLWRDDLVVWRRWRAHAVVRCTQANETLKFHFNKYTGKAPKDRKRSHNARANICLYTRRNARACMSNNSQRFNEKFLFACGGLGDVRVVRMVVGPKHRCLPEPERQSERVIRRQSVCVPRKYFHL